MEEHIKKYIAKMRLLGIEGLTLRIIGNDIILKTNEFKSKLHKIERTVIINENSNDWSNTT